MEIWNDSLWKSMYLMIYNLPENPNYQDKQRIVAFFENWSILLPNNDIKKEYQKLLQDYPIINYIDNKKELLKWLNDIHNKINRKFKLPPVPLKIILNSLNKEYNKNIETFSYTFNSWNLSQNQKELNENIHQNGR